MLVTRLYSGDDGRSHFEELDLPLAIGEAGALSGPIPIESIFFRDTGEAGPEVWDFHVAPRRQFALHLKGRTEIEVGDGTAQVFGPGDVLLADDLTGQGHISREVEGPRFQVFAVLSDRVDLARWRR
ncbi:MAG: hypothetical protein OEV40_13270 [Acidimicrobiia bacterium]|nr:hypothetical protein [Acidimicrobiia bacterium]